MPAQNSVSASLTASPNRATHNFWLFSRITGDLNGTLVTNGWSYYGFKLSVTYMDTGPQLNLRNSIRFPLHLQVTLKTPTHEYRAKTTDISAGGMLFHTEYDIAVGSPVEFTIEMPGDVLGTHQPVLVKCQGRVVRCLEEALGRSVAVVIDEYHFERK